MCVSECVFYIQLVDVMTFSAVAVVSSFEADDDIHTMWSG